MPQSWNKLCITSGYVEVMVLLHGLDESTEGYQLSFSLPFAFVRVIRPLSWVMGGPGCYIRNA
jgi:hypothetical protein